MKNDDNSGPAPPEPSAAARKAERFERQARALRENLRRRNQQRRAGGQDSLDEADN